MYRYVSLTQVKTTQFHLFFLRLRRYTPSTVTPDTSGLGPELGVVSIVECSPAVPVTHTLPGRGVPLASLLPGLQKVV